MIALDLKQTIAAYERAGTTWYDNEDELTYVLRHFGHAGFDAVRVARRVAGYDRRERLKDWTIKGRYWLDTCGNSWVAHERFGEELVKGRAEDGTLGVGTCSVSPIAHATDRCVRCGLGWDLRTAHEVRHVEEDCYHAGCHELKVHEHVRSKFTGLVSALSLDVELLAVPNLYGAQAWSGPWFVFDHAKLGKVCIGWRKRTIQISWTEGPDGRELFSAEEVTKDRGLVHAWGYDDARDYLKRLLNA